MGYPAVIRHHFYILSAEFATNSNGCAWRGSTFVTHCTMGIFTRVPPGDAMTNFLPAALSGLLEETINFLLVKVNLEARNLIHTSE